jgi:chromosome segregation ATPase|tara:strand:- start:133 stop:1362 length:1230 start_codon:yes stop_codon:yes gene_type:complete
MITIFSIKDIVDATNNILESSNKSENMLSKEITHVKLKKKIYTPTDTSPLFEENVSPLALKDPPIILEDTSLILKEKDSIQTSIPTEIERIIIEAEDAKNLSSKLSQYDHVKNDDLIKNQPKENGVSKKILIDDLYDKFGKKIKKNTLKLILELRNEIFTLNNKIISLKNKNDQSDQNNIFLKNDINQLQNDERKLNYNIKKNKQDFEIIKKQYENTISEFKLNELVQQTKIQKLQDDILFNDKLLNDSKNKNLKLEKENSELKKQLSNVQHLNIYKEELQKLKLKNIDLEDTVNKFKSLNNDDNQNLDIIKTLEDKIKFYQEENIRISSELVESNKKFSVTKESLDALQNQRSDLIEKLNSINHVIKGENIISNLFNEDSDKENNNYKPENKIKSKDINKEIKDIFNR